MEIKKILEKQKSFFYEGKSHSVSYRKEQLILLKNILKNNEHKLMDALYTDMKKPFYEAFSVEINFTIQEINFMLRNLKKLSSVKKVNSPVALWPAESLIYPEPYGVVLIISPFNYPVYLSLNPLIGAMTAGNCAILKLSGKAPATGGILQELINDNYDSNYIHVVDNNFPDYPHILDLEFDYIFFTGSSRTGKMVMEKASKHLTPVTLELSGKNPALFDTRVDFDESIRKITWGKFFNAGQSCIAPNHLVIHRDQQETVLKLMKKYLRQFYSENPKTSPDFARIIDGKSVEKLSAGIDFEKLIYGGGYNKDDRFFEPTILDDVSWDDPVMQQEIFGPVLPVLYYENLDDFLEFQQTQPRPLCFYFFSKDKRSIKLILNRVKAGNISINEILLHAVSHKLPFGGTGNSGIGKYHGRFSFDAFTHYKSVIKGTKSWFDFIRYPPYIKSKKIARFIISRFTS